MGFIAFPSATDPLLTPSFPPSHPLRTPRRPQVGFIAFPSEAVKEQAMKAQDTIPVCAAILSQIVALTSEQVRSSPPPHPLLIPLTVIGPEE
eukprot:1000546-Prorocentrum_minimum.AAC.1